MNTNTLESLFEQQRLSNGYELIDGVAMHVQNGDRFQIPADVIKRHVGIGHFVELRIDSPRFSVHEDAPEKCTCDTCKGEATKPILRHEHPASLLPLPKSDLPSRGWGEDFWVQVTARAGRFFSGTVDNPLYEARLHGLRQGDALFFHEDHVLAVHAIHRRDLVAGMDEADLKQLVDWLGRQNETG